MGRLGIKFDTSLSSLAIKKLKKIVELVNAENTAVKEQITNYADAERSIANLNDIQHDLKHTLKDAVGYGTAFAQNIGQAATKNKEAFKNFYRWFENIETIPYFFTKKILFFCFRPHSRKPF